ncbi:MAG TPA: lysine--tRNA ligase [Candidatus Marinimicrobia bacterium]|nr:lysine--tRNA ligase [Candidatus Neomarinimicrobiota bacterium]
MDDQKHSTLDDIISQRKEKIENIRQLGINPYPYAYNISHYSKSIIQQFDSLENETVQIAGRLMAIRLMGKAAFANILDSQGKIQIYLNKTAIGEKNYELFRLLDIGDFIGISGKVIKTRTGEITIQAESLTLLSKNIRPLPIVKEKDGVAHDAFTDKEQRYRKRYLDLIVNPQVRDVFINRSKILQAIRRFFDMRDFLEVETPVLQPLYGGANARPFTTYHNTLDRTLYLRIADELYLKRLIIGGFDKVYEIAKNFRNEGMDRNHNPEFTAIEFYQAYVDYNYMMDLVEKLFQSVAQALEVETAEFSGHTIKLMEPFARKPMFTLFEEYLGENISDYDIDKLRLLAKEKGLEIGAKANYGQILDELFGEFIEPKLIQPTFVTDYPKAISPLAKTHRSGNPQIVERFELFIGGSEFANAFSELNDPVDQRERLEAQAKLRDLGDEEAQVLDEDFLQAVEIGMPPTGGVGVGIDRLVMLFTGQASIKDVLLFPAMRPESAHNPEQQ